MKAKKKKAKHTLTHRVTELENMMANARITELYVFVHALRAELKKLKTRLEQTQQPAEPPPWMKGDVRKCILCGNDGDWHAQGNNNISQCRGYSPPEKPAAEKSVGPWVNHVWNGRVFNDSFRYAYNGCTCMVRIGQTGGPNSPWRIYIEDGEPIGGKHEDYPTEAEAKKACDAILLARGWTLYGLPTPDTVEEDKLKDAVVDAALVWDGACNHDPQGYCGHVRDVLDAATALRAHRTKKGGA